MVDVPHPHNGYLTIKRWRVGCGQNASCTSSRQAKPVFLNPAPSDTTEKYIDLQVGESNLNQGIFFGNSQSSVVEIGIFPEPTST